MNTGICATLLNADFSVGIGNYTTNLIEQMNILNFGGQDITLVNYQPQSRFINNELIIPAKMPMYREYAWYMDLSRKIKLGDIDLLHNPSAHLTRGKFKVPYVATVMDLVPLIHPEFMTKPQALLWKLFAKKSFLSADHLIAISQSTKNDLIKFCGIPPEKITVVYPGISPIFRKFVFNHAQIEQRYNIREPFVLYVGSIDPRKNVELLIRAMKDVDPRYDLVIAGRMGWKMETPAAIAKRYNLSHRVHWLGYVPEEDKVKLYNMASCLVFPSQYEGFGLPPAEAMACGCPVICANNSSLPEATGKHGLLIPLDKIAGKRIACAIGSAVEWPRVSINRFSWAESAKQIWKIYEKVVDEL